MARRAQLSLWLMDGTSGTAEVPPEVQAQAGEFVRVRTKADLMKPGDDPGGRGGDELVISVKTGEGLRHLEDLLQVKARAMIPHPEVPALTQVRHRVLIEEARGFLSAFLDGEGRPIELRAEDLRLAAVSLGKITGRVDVEDVLDLVFQRFCIGK